MCKAGEAERAAARTTASARTHNLGNAHVIWARQGEVATSLWRRNLDWRGWCCEKKNFCRDLADVRTQGS